MSVRRDDRRSAPSTGGAEHLGALLDRLDADPGRAGDSYNRHRARLIRHFAWQGCTPAEDLADTVLDRVARRLAEGEQVPNIGAYLLGVARLVALEHRRHATYSADRLREYARQIDSGTDPVDHEARARCLDRCLAALSPDRRALVTAYYSTEGRTQDERQRLAARVGLHMNALRNRVLRIRQQLETCVGTCLGPTPARDEPPPDATSVRWARIRRPRR